MIKSYFKNPKLSQLLVLSLCVLVIFLIVYKHYRADGYDEFISVFPSVEAAADFGLPIEVFYTIQTSMSAIEFSLFLMIFSPNIFSADYYASRKNGFINLIKQRQTKKNQFLQPLLLNSILSFLYALFFQLVLLLAVYIIVGPFHFNAPNLRFDSRTYMIAFSSNPMFSMIIYIIVSSIGFMLFSNLIFSIQRLFKNIYIYRGSGLILGIGLTVLTALIWVTLYRNTNLEFFIILGSLMFYPNLVNPGLQHLTGYKILGSTVATFGASVLFFGVIISLCLYINYRLERIYG